MSAARKVRRNLAMLQNKAATGHLKELQRKEDRDLLARRELEVLYLNARLSEASKDIARVRESRARLVKLVRAVPHV